MLLHAEMVVLGNGHLKDMLACTCHTPCALCMCRRRHFCLATHKHVTTAARTEGTSESSMLLLKAVATLLFLGPSEPAPLLLACMVVASCTETS